MKLKFIFGLLAFSLFILSLLLYIKEDSVFEIISVPSIHSFYKSSETETYNIELLTNNTQDYHFVTDYISSGSIQSLDENELIPLQIIEFKTTENTYLYKNTSYQVIELSFKIAFDSPDYEIIIPEAYLHIQYSNNEDILIKIGEFHYRFLSNQPDDLLIGSIQSTVMKLSDVSSVSGLAIEITNNAIENIVIQSINLGTTSVSSNNFYMTQINALPDLFDAPKEVLGISYFDYLDQAIVFQKNFLLQEHTTNYLYIPFQYLSTTNFLHRFYVIITYEVSGETKQIIIDDFPYIRTNLFQTATESEFIRYVFEN
ncbi:MAG: hypothetical protein JXR62_06150 [Bacilli bacterium]|nr:hypothetical protein [Bacilli bacterium]